jgi:hypothetical protein
LQKAALEGSFLEPDSNIPARIKAGSGFEALVFVTKMKWPVSRFKKSKLVD